MRFAVLGSGSRGNSVYVEQGRTAILLDAGFTGKEIVQRLAAIDRDPRQLAAIFLSHEHNDHIAGAGVLSRRLSIPVYANRGTALAGERKMGRLHQWCEFASGDRVVLGDLQIHTFPVSHDTSDPVGFLVSHDTQHLGCCTDTGRVTRLMRTRLSGCQALILEFNHNLEMLRNGPYPLELQQRIRSGQGHLANEDAASLLQELQHDSLRYAVLAHLSETNNTPQLAWQAACAVMDSSMDTQLFIASQYHPSELFSL